MASHRKTPITTRSFYGFYTIQHMLIIMLIQCWCHQVCFTVQRCVTHHQSSRSHSVTSQQLTHSLLCIMNPPRGKWKSTAQCQWRISFNSKRRCSKTHEPAVFSQEKRTRKAGLPHPVCLGSWLHQGHGSEHMPAAGPSVFSESDPRQLTVRAASSPQGCR